MHIPADIPASHRDIYIKNIQTLTKKTEHIFLLAGDQKIEHLNTDFYGPGIHPDAAHPEHLFKIASATPIGAFATHVGLITQYGTGYRNIPYIAKLNGKTDLIDKATYTDIQSKPDPISRQLWSVHDVITLQKNANLHIIGVGYTIYLGSKFEHIMLHEAAQTIMHAHQNGLIAILWIYPRGKAIQEDNTVELLAGAAGLANTLGADVVKLKTPKERAQLSVIEQFHVINEAAGTTKAIYAGGNKIDSQNFIKKINLYIQEGGIAGVAVGRNIFQHSLNDAITITNAIAKVVYNIS